MIKFITKTGYMFESEEIVRQSSLEECLKYCKKRKFLGLDIETTGLKFTEAELLLLQIGDENQQFVIDCTTVDCSPLKPLLEDKQKVKILHNAKYDYKFLRNKNIVLESVYDTMLAEIILYNGKEGIRMSYDKVVERNLGVTKLSKQQRSSFINFNGTFSEADIIYAAKDVQYSVPTYRKQRQMLENKRQLNVARLECEASLGVGDIEYNGLYLNADKWNRQAAKVRKILQTEKIKLYDMVEDLGLGEKYVPRQGLTKSLFDSDEDVRRKALEQKLSFNSPLQVKDLFQNLIPNLDSVGAPVLEALHNPPEIVNQYLHYKEQEKLLSTYGPSFLEHRHQDHKIHPEFKMIVRTGRMSCSSPNMQQVPGNDEYRSAFETGDKDWVFVSSDYESQELAVIAVGSGDPVWLETIRSGRDLHSTCASLLYGDTWKQAGEADCAFENEGKKCSCPQHKKLRTKAKTLDLGLSYGMSGYSLAKHLKISEDEAEELIDLFFSTFPKIRKFLQSCGRFGVKNGYIKTFPPFGRKRYFDQWGPWMANKPYQQLTKVEKGLIGEVRRASMNTPIQGTSADMMKKAIVLVRRFIIDNQVPARLVMQVHDQLDTIAHKDFAEEWKEILTRLMEDAAQIILGNNLLKTDTNISEFWKK